MGDSGSMLVGLMLSAAAITATTNVDPQGFNSLLVALPLALPLIIPLSVLAIPFVDLVLAVIRRVRKRRSPFAPDKQHLHHRLLALGHSHRRAVLLLYFWTALLAFGGTAVSVFRGVWVWVAIIGARRPARHRAARRAAADQPATTRSRGRHAPPRGRRQRRRPRVPAAAGGRAKRPLSAVIGWLCRGNPQETARARAAKLAEPIGRCDL